MATATQRKEAREGRPGFAAWVERHVADLAPAWALRRKRARVQLAAAERLENIARTRAARHRLGYGGPGSYDAAQPSRLRKVRRPVGGSGDDHLSARTLWTLRETSRDICRNNPLAIGLLQTDADNLIGPEWRFEAQTDSSAWNEEAEGWLNEEWMTEGADITGRQHFVDLLFTGLRTQDRDGDLGFVFHEGHLVPIEGDRIASPRNSDSAVVNGVEVDRFLRPRAYHVAEEHPTSAYVQKAQRVPARDFLHWYEPDRLSGTRGVPILAPVFDDIDRISETLDVVVIAHEMAACFGVVEKTQDGWDLPGTEETNPDTGASERVQELEPGLWKRLDPGQDLVQIRPEHPGQQFGELIDTLCRFTGRHMGLPLELVLLNFSHSNFSNTRAALLQAFRSWERRRNWLRRNVLRRVYRYAIGHGMKHGHIGYHPQAFRHASVGPGWVWVDMLKDIEADLKLLSVNATTETRIAAKYGGHRGDILKTRRREIAEDAELHRLRAQAEPDGADAGEPGED